MRVLLRPHLYPEFPQNPSQAETLMQFQPLNTFVVRILHRGEREDPRWVGQVRHLQSDVFCIFIDFATMEDFILSFGGIDQEETRDLSETLIAENQG